MCNQGLHWPGMRVLAVLVGVMPRIRLCIARDHFVWLSLVELENIEGLGGRNHISQVTSDLKVGGQTKGREGLLTLVIVVCQTLGEHVVNDDMLGTCYTLTCICTATLIDLPQGHAEMPIQSFLRRFGPTPAASLLSVIFRHNRPVVVRWPWAFSSMLID